MLGKYEEIKKAISSKGGYVSISKYLIHAIGLNEAILFSELLSKQIYFIEKNMVIEDGYFYNTQYNLLADTGLGEKAQRNVISKLKLEKLVECKLKGLPAKRHFKVTRDANIINELMQKGKRIYESTLSQQDTSIGGNLKLPRKELDTVLGSVNNTNTNNNKEIILKKINVVLANRKDVSFFENIIRYYLTRYESYMRQEHPLLNTLVVMKVVDNIVKFASEHDIVTQADWRDMIDYYFRCNLECDRNILHFSSYEILYNRANNLNLC